MNTARKIIRRLGGAAALSRALGHKYPSTVQAWGDSGRIPVWRIPEVIKVAKGLGIEISFEDFFETET